MAIEKQECDAQIRETYQLVTLPAMIACLARAPAAQRAAVAAQQQGAKAGREMPPGWKMCQGRADVEESEPEFSRTDASAG